MDAKVSATQQQPTHPTNPTFAIAGIPDAYVAIDKHKFGRRSAGAGFLEAVCRYFDKEDYTLAVVSEADLQVLHLAMSQYPDAAPTLNSINLGDQAALARSGALFVPSPSIRDYVWTRRLKSDNAYSLVGITHSIATLQATPMLCNFVIEPVQPWDALICTSESVKRTIRNLHENYLGYLRERGIIAPPPPLQLPVIPLGVHCDRFAATEKRQEAARNFREEHGIASEDVVLLHFGRIDPASKSHPVPLYIAAQHAQTELAGDGKLHLVVAGTVPGGKVIEKEIRDAATSFAPDVSIHWVDGEDDALCDTVWHVADIFVSLSDNVQESFGLTPVEAMAAGLPCVVSEWDGYKETVVNGVTGILIPTYMPDRSTGIGAELANRYCGNTDNEIMYMYGLSQVTAVDVGKCARAIATLARDPEMRSRMGAAGRQRAEQVFSWRNIIPYYRELLSELGEIRNTEKGFGMISAGDRCIRPDLGDPFAMFGQYPTKTMAFDWEVTTSEQPSGKLLSKLARQPMCTLTSQHMCDPQTMTTIIESARTKPSTINGLADVLPHMSPASIMSTCMWLAKYGILEVRQASQDSSDR